MPAAECANCGSRLTKKARFCPECGARVGASSDETAIQELPPERKKPSAAFSRSFCGRTARR